MTKRRTMMITGLSAAALITGGTLAAAALPAIAETTSSTEAAATPTPSSDPSTGGHRANGITETALTGDTAAKVKAAVLATYPDATIERLETDAEGVYEAHVEQADGTQATVKLDENFAVTGIETGGHGHGGHNDNETALTGDTATKVEAAVLAKYPDVTVRRLETDAEGAYEAHVQQADGTQATVKLDDTFTVTGIETGGHGHGDDDSTSTDDTTTS
jgi:uncharacterized membrane protein YkoI